MHGQRTFLVSVVAEQLECLSRKRGADVRIFFLLPDQQVRKGTSIARTDHFQPFNEVKPDAIALAWTLKRTRTPVKRTTTPVIRTPYLKCIAAVQNMRRLLLYDIVAEEDVEVNVHLLGYPRVPGLFLRSPKLFPR